MMNSSNNKNKQEERIGDTSTKRLTLINPFIANNTFSHKVINNSVPSNESESEKLSRTPKYILDSDARISMPRAIFGNEVMTNSRFAFCWANIYQNPSHALQDDDDEDDEIFIGNMMKRYNENVKRNGGKMPVRAFPTIAKQVEKRKKKNCLLNETHVNLMKRFRAEMAAAKANKISPLDNSVASSRMTVTSTSNINHQESSKDDKIFMITKDASTQTSFRLSNADNEDNSTNKIPSITPINKVKVNTFDQRSIISTVPTYCIKNKSKIGSNGGPIVTRASMPQLNSIIHKRPLTFSPTCSMYDPITKSERGSIGCPTLPTSQLQLFPSQLNINDDFNEPFSQASTVSISAFYDDPSFF